MFTAEVDSRAVLAWLDRLGPSVDFVAKEVARDTANRIVAEAQRRSRRATGATAAEIHWELTRDGKGYIVLGYDPRINKTLVEVYQEYGTSKMGAHQFFFSSALLEEGAHRRRLVDRIQEFLDSVGR
jgi:hypothetical protein